jgi:hypothetical protein
VTHREGKSLAFCTGGTRSVATKNRTLHGHFTTRGIMRRSESAAIVNGADAWRFQRSRGYTVLLSFRPKWRSLLLFKATKNERCLEVDLT